MKTTLLLIFLSTLTQSFGQGRISEDSLAVNLCDKMSFADDTPDSSLIISILKEDMLPYLSNYRKSQKDVVVERILTKLQGKCPAFLTFSNKVIFKKSGIQYLSQKSESKLTVQQCKDFFISRNYRIILKERDTTHIEITNNYWIVRYNDGSYSKSIIRQFDNCEFEIEFINSTNRKNKNNSKPGNKFHYYLIDRKESRFVVMYEDVSKNMFFTFEVFY